MVVSEFRQGVWKVSDTTRFKYDYDVRKIQNLDDARVGLHPGCNSERSLILENLWYASGAGALALRRCKETITNKWCH